MRNQSNMNMKERSRSFFFLMILVFVASNSLTYVKISHHPCAAFEIHFCLFFFFSSLSAPSCVVNRRMRPGKVNVMVQRASKKCEILNPSQQSDLHPLKAF